MKITIDAAELAEFVVLMCKAHNITENAPAEDNKYTQAVGKAIQEAVEVKSKKKSSRKVDTGKIKALYEGKWSIKAIADEMKCSEQTVRNVIKEASDEGK